MFIYWLHVISVVLIFDTIVWEPFGWTFGHVCTYIYIHVGIYVNICVCLYVYVCVCVYMYIYMHIHTHTHIHINVHAYMWIHIHTCIRVQPNGSQTIVSKISTTEITCNQ